MDNLRQNAGHALYLELLQTYQCEETTAKDAVGYAALKYADSKKDEDHIEYRIAKARLTAASKAKCVLTSRAGELARLDVKAPT